MSSRFLHIDFVYVVNDRVYVVLRIVFIVFLMTLGHGSHVSSDKAASVICLSIAASF